MELRSQFAHRPRAFRGTAADRLSGSAAGGGAAERIREILRAAAQRRRARIRQPLQLLLRRRDRLEGLAWTVGLPDLRLGVLKNFLELGIDRGRLGAVGDL